MIRIRLPWRPRARPSATLHEIPVRSVKNKLEQNVIADRAVCQVRPLLGSGSVILTHYPLLGLRRRLEFAQSRHRRRRWILALAILLAPFGLGGVMILGHCNLLFSRNLVGVFTHARPK